MSRQDQCAESRNDAHRPKQPAFCRGYRQLSANRFAAPSPSNSRPSRSTQPSARAGFAWSFSLFGWFAPDLHRHRRADTHDAKREFKTFPDPHWIAGEDKLGEATLVSWLGVGGGIGCDIEKISFVHAQSPRQIECCAELGRRASEGESALSPSD